MSDSILDLIKLIAMMLIMVEHTIKVMIKTVMKIHSASQMLQPAWKMLPCYPVELKTPQLKPMQFGTP